MSNVSDETVLLIIYGKSNLTAFVTPYIALHVQFEKKFKSVTQDMVQHSDRHCTARVDSAATVILIH